MNPFLRRCWATTRWSWATAAATIESNSAPASNIRSGTNRRNSATYSVSTPWFSPGQNRTSDNRRSILGLAGLQRRQSAGQRQSAAHLRRRWLRRCVQRRPEVRDRPVLRDRCLRNAQGSESQQRRHRLQSSHLRLPLVGDQLAAARFRRPTICLVSQYPGVAANDGFSAAGISRDIADESAFKVGAQYTFGFRSVGQRNLRVLEARSCRPI